MTDSKSGAKPTAPGSLERFDPVEAMLSGITSTFGRMVVGLCGVLLAYGTNLAANTGGHNGLMLFPFALLFTIFAWAEHGVWFLAGFAAVLGGVYALYRLVLDEEGKACWFVIYALFVLYFSPMNFNRTDWPDARGKGLVEALETGIGDPVLRRDWIALLVIFAAGAVLYWIMPAAVVRVAGKYRQIRARRIADQPPGSFNPDSEE